jgi:dolichol-phosphate mannosyltransferase
VPLRGEFRNQAMANNKVSVAVVCKIANEETTMADFTRSILGEFDVAKLINIECSLIYIIDQFSSDNTLTILQQLCKEDKRVNFFFNQNAITLVDSDILAYKKGIESKSDWIVDINGGFRHQPKDLKLFFDFALSAKYDAICGTRFQTGTNYTIKSLQRKIFSKGGTIIGNVMLGTQFTDLTSGFIMFKRELLVKILEKPIHSKYHFLQTELKWKIQSITKNYIEIPIAYTSNSGPLKARVILDACINLMRFTLVNLFNKMVQ